MQGKAIKFCIAVYEYLWSFYLIFGSIFCLNYGKFILKRGDVMNKYLSIFDNSLNLL